MTNKYKTHTTGGASIVCYWHRPLGACEGTFALTLQQQQQQRSSAGSRRTAPIVAVWSLPLTLPELILTLKEHHDNSKRQQQQATTLQIAGNAWDNLTEKELDTICTHLRSIRRLHVTMGVSSRAVVALLQRLRPCSLVVWTLDERILHAINQYSLVLRELRVQSTAATVSTTDDGQQQQWEALLLETLRKQQNNIQSLYLNQPLKQWKVLFQIMEDSTSLLDFHCECISRNDYTNNNHGHDYLQCMVKANWYRQQQNTKCDDAVWTVWKDWYRATHRPDLQERVTTSPNHSSCSLTKSESLRSNCT